MSTMDATSTSLWPTPDGLYEDDMKPDRFAQEKRLTRPPGDVPEGPLGRGRPDEGVGASAEGFHSGLVAEDAATAQGARRIDSEHG